MSTVLGANDHQIMDDVETVTLMVFAEDGSILDQDSVAYAWHTPLSREEFLDEGMFTKESKAWQLPVTLCSLTPKEGSMIVDSSSVQWMVQLVTKPVGGTMYRCLCNRSRNQADSG